MPDNFCWDKHKLVSGVPQGGILSPIIFTIYTADLELWLKKSSLFNEAKKAIAVFIRLTLVFITIVCLTKENNKPFIHSFIHQIVFPINLK